jgi:cytochrome c5
MRSTRTLAVGTTWCILLIAACNKPEAAPPTDSGRPTANEGGVTRDLLVAAAMVALPPPGITPTDLPEPQTQGARNVAEFCSVCHNIPSPTTHSATDWPSTARRMWLRIDLLAENPRVKVPTIQQRQVMLQYLVDHALQVSGATLPAGPGRSAFSETCSRCHALPDPRQHSPADWPQVVLRMGQRMDQLKLNRPTPEQTQQIIAYLSQVSNRKK